MCGRFVLTLTWAQIAELYRLAYPSEPPSGFRTSYNIAPSQQVLVIGRGDHGPEPRMMRWGFIPAWAKERPSAAPINARGEAVASSRMFQAAFKVRRCLVPASGFFEWQKQPAGGKQPYWVGMKDDAPFSIAGIWERWSGGKGAEPVDSFAVLTTEPNAVTAPIHDRMPVIIAPSEYEAWLTVDSGQAKELIRPYPPEAMKAYPISTRVNSPGNDDPAIISPIA
jgi:putative SOS response-associated peptidase YedK